MPHRRFFERGELGVVCEVTKTNAPKKLKVAASGDGAVIDKSAPADANKARLAELVRMADAPAPKRSGIWSWLWFLAAVVLPIATTAAYLFAFTTPKYAASFRYVIQSGNPQAEAPSPSGRLTAGAMESTELHVTSFMVSDYLSSPQMVIDLEERLDLRAMFAKESIDQISRLRDGSNREALARYWKRRVTTEFDMTTGLTYVTVTAFTAEDALSLANEMVVFSEDLVNSLGSRARQDTIDLAEERVENAERSMQDARQAVQEFRVSNLSVDPASEAGMTDDLLATLNEQYVELTTELSILRSQLNTDSRLIIQLEQKAKSLNEAIDAARGQVASQGAVGSATREAYATQLREFQNLQLDLDMATARYQSSVMALDNAREQASRKHFYIQTYVLPTLPEVPNGQKTMRILLVVAVSAIGLWIVTSLVVAAIRDKY